MLPLSLCILLALQRLRASFGEQKFRRLQKVKHKYDPSNFFRLNQNIPPTVHESRTVAGG
jgi:hypothetical protein